MSKQDRQGVRTASDIERKYKLGAYDKRMDEAKKIAESAREDVEKIFDQVKQTFQAQLDEAVDEMTETVDGIKEDVEKAVESAGKVDGYEQRITTLEENVARIPTIDLFYPVGSIYLTVNDIDPVTLFPGTTWEKLEGIIPWFVNGEFEVVISNDDITVNTGGDGTDVPPYIQIYAWRRVENPEEPEVPEEEGDDIGS